MASSSDRAYAGALVPDVQAMTSGAAVPRIDQFAAVNPGTPLQVPVYDAANVNYPALAMVPWQPSSTLAAPVSATPNTGSAKATLAAFQPSSTKALPTTGNMGATATTQGTYAGQSGVQ